MNSNFNMDDHDIVGNEVFPLPIIIYSESDSQASEIVRNRLDELSVPFVEIDVAQDESAARYVEHVNHGQLVTPTIVFGNEDFIIVEPTRNDLDRALRRAGYEF